MKIKTGDMVAVIAGGDQFETNKKGQVTRKTGRVIKVFPKTNRVIVEGVNISTFHEAPSQQNEKGSIVKKERPISASNVMVLDPKTNEPTRITVKIENGKKVRYAAKTGNKLDK